MTGFRFNNTHSGSMGCWMVSTDRTVRPEKRVYRYSIPGRSGTIKAEDGTFEDRVIRLRISFTGAALTRASLRERVRSVASWLSGSGPLEFDDEPGVCYQATVQSGISLDQITVTGSCEVIFLCDPFAYEAAASTVYETNVSVPETGGAEITCVSAGNVETDCWIIVMAQTAINTLHIKHESNGWNSGEIELNWLDMTQRSRLDIKTESMTVEKNGSNALAKLSSSYGDLSVLRLEPGTNKFKIYGTPSTADVYIQWNNRWL